jgi:uncharacterized protein (DUF39 family)
MAKTIAEINRKIADGEVVVVTADEMIDVVGESGAAKAAEQVDVVTTGTFGPMCSSGAFINLGHANPRIKIQRAWLNGVPAYAGLAAVDIYIGATEMPENDPLNREHPGEFRYGGAHVIQELVAGEDVHLRATAYGTDCYPGCDLDTLINIADLNECVLCNPRNAYQNYNVAVNLDPGRDIYTYMGVLKADLGSANYCSAGQLSPLLNDPFYRTIGIGTRIFLGGSQGYVFWQGTQHNPTVPRTEGGVPKAGAGTLSVVGDMKEMAPEWIVGVSMYGYGVSLQVGLGAAIPVLDEEMARFTAVRDEEIVAPVVDYSHGYPYGEVKPLGHVNYRDLKSGRISVQGREIPTASLSSYPKARQVARILKEWVQAGRFLLTEPAGPLPSADSGLTFKPLRECAAREEAE